MVVPCLVVSTLRLLHCLGENNFLSMILFLIKTFFYCFSNSSIFLAEKAIEAAKVQNDGNGIIF